MSNYDALKEDVRKILFEYDITEIESYMINGHLYNFSKGGENYLLRFPVQNDRKLFKSILFEVIQVIEAHGFKTKPVCEDVHHIGTVYKAANVYFM